MNSERWQLSMRWVTVVVLIHIAFTFVLCLRDVDLPSGGSTELHLTLPNSTGPLYACDDNDCVCCTPLLVVAVNSFEWNPVAAGFKETVSASPIAKYVPPLKYPPRA